MDGSAGGKYPAPPYTSSSSAQVALRTLDLMRMVLQQNQSAIAEALPQAAALSDQRSTPFPYRVHKVTTPSYDAASGVFANCTANCTNGTDPTDTPHTVTEVVLISIVVTILAVVTAGGNLMVMISFKMDKQLQTVSNYFLFSLSVADCFIGFISMPLYTVYLLMKRWPLGPIICDSWLAVDYTMSNASVANLLLISFDRYFSVTRPLTYRAKRTPKRAAIMISLAWIISVLMWSPWIFAWPYIEGKRTVPDDACYIQFLTTNQYITVITAMAAFYLPVLIMCILYFKIYLETEKRNKGLAKLTAQKTLVPQRKYGESSDEDVCTSLSQKRSDSSPDFEDLVEFEEEDLSKHRGHKRTCMQHMRNCCKIDHEASEYNDDSSSSENPGSPAYGECTPSSSQAPMQGGLVHQNGKQHGQTKHSDSALMIPLINVDSNRSTPMATPSTDITGTFSRHSNLSQATAMTSADSERSGRARDKDMYTILIKLPEGNSGPNAKPTIRMISESDEEDVPEHQPMRRSESHPEGHHKIELKRVSSGPGGDSIASGKRYSQTADSLRMAVQARLAAKMATKVKAQRTRKRNQERKQDKKAAKTLSAILLAFVITWTPYNIFTVVQTFCTDACIDPTLYAIGELLLLFTFVPFLLSGELRLGPDRFRSLSNVIFCRVRSILRRDHVHREVKGTVPYSSSSSSSPKSPISAY